MNLRPIGWAVVAAFIAVGVLGCYHSPLGGPGESTCSPAPHIEGTPPPLATVGHPYAATFTGWYFCGLGTCFSLEAESLPPGATLDGHSVVWTPAPADAGTTQVFRVRTAPDACGDSAHFEWTVQVVAAPEIQAFTATPAALHPGEHSRLTAVFSHGAGWIEGIGEVVSGVPVDTPALSSATTFTLRVTTPTGIEASQTLTIQVHPVPVILAFGAAPTLLTAGDPTELRWDAQGATHLQIDPGAVEVTTWSRLVVNPAVDTRYTLTATNPLGDRAQASCDVHVVPPPSIQSFTATPTQVPLGGTVALLAVFTGGTGLLPTGPVTSGVAVTSPPLTGATSMALQVTNAAGTFVMQWVSVAVTGPHTFQDTATPLARVRQGATATRLPDGRVLIAGGWDPGPPDLRWSDTELFDPASGSFSPGPTLVRDRYLAAAAPLPGGRVLLVAGELAPPLGTAEICDPIAGTSMAVASPLPSPWYDMTAKAVSLPGGDVLVAYGHVAARFNPATGAFTLLSGQQGYTSQVVPLADGRALLLDSTSGLLSTYDPASDTFAPAGDLGRTNLASPTVQPLADGRVLVASGLGAQLWDPATGLVSATGVPAAWLQATASAQLPDGSVVLAGGQTSAGLRSAQRFDPISGAFSLLGELLLPRSTPWMTFTPLQDGRALVVGGVLVSGPGDRRRGELYQP
ncbi:MAG TPA: kelch repeat-containing protein [Holophagaceae bacterium]|nr:kelch repeat-containing protein [Holophagaceae bacterium]